jgi:FkbM family methyltransferase
MPTSLAFDLGANIGQKVTELLAAGYDRVVAVEPLHDNPFPDNPKVIWIKSLVSNSTEPRQIFPAGTVSTVERDFMQGRFKGYTWASPITCQATTISNLIDAYGVPDFIKTDVEGHEKFVLMGLPSPCPVPLLAFEWSEEHRDDAFQCVSILESLGYREFALQFEDAGVLPPSNWLTVDQLAVAFDDLCATKHLAWGMLWARK